MTATLEHRAAATVAKPVRAAVYLRQSLDRTGEGLAVARQREDCLRLCAERGWQLSDRGEGQVVAARAALP